MATAGARTVRRTTDAAQTSHEQARMARLNGVMLKIVGVVLLVSAFLYITGMARIAEGARSINALLAQIATERSNCQQLDIALRARYNEDMIEDQAVSRLGMSSPDPASVRVVPLYAVKDGERTVYVVAEESTAP